MIKNSLLDVIITHLPGVFTRLQSQKVRPWTVSNYILGQENVIHLVTAVYVCEPELVTRLI